MSATIEFLPEAESNYNALDSNLKKIADRKIQALSNYPLLGKPIIHEHGTELSGFYKIFFDKDRYRIVYRLTGDTQKAIEIFNIGTRDDALTKIFNNTGNY